MTSIARSAAAVLMTAALSACATAPAAETTPSTTAGSPAAAFDAAGTYDFNTQVGGQSVDGVVRLARNANGGWGGSVSSPVTGEMPVRAVAVEGNRVRVTASGNQGDLVLNLDVAGTRVSGNWSYAGQGGALTGSRR
ncbi:hypothetical protein [Longimicrobium sp.]|uniref:hypothetical protein n=1 Tax=Longimicrobium sp. TaxID=2029185 RepID=UPI002EDAE8B1